MATPNITLQDILNRTNDLLQNYTTSSIDLGNRIRAINSAMEYVKRRMTLPSDEVIQNVNFTQDNLFYDLENDFNEGLQLIYSDYSLNFPGNNWTYAPYADILRMSGRQFTNQNYFSWTPINGKMQLVMFGRNLNQGQTLATFDSITNGGFVAENDAQNLQVDTNIVYEGSGSLRFDINPALGGTGMASIYWPTNFDFTQTLQSSGSFKLAVWLPSGQFTEINLVLITDTLDYYVVSATAFADGTAFTSALNQWKLVEFDMVGAIANGSPAINDITAMRVDLVLNGSFGSGVVQNFRIDDLYSVFPDPMDFIYLTSFKGTDTTGVTSKIFLTDASDIPAFGNFVPDLLDVIAYRAAVILVPQILSNAEFRSMYKSEQEDIMNIYGKSWPRKRVLNMGKLVLSRPR